MSTPNVNFFISYIPSLKGEADTLKGKLNFEKRNFYTAKSSYNFVDYIEKGSKEKIDFIDYSGNQEKSEGIFNQEGLMDKEDIKILKDSLRNTDSPIWHGLISFEEKFGEMFCNNYEDAYELMDKEFPKFLKNAGFKKDNITWFAALHENTDNRHIHFSFFENTPIRQRRNRKGSFYSHGPVSMFSIERAKRDIELKLTDWNIKVKNLRNDLISETNDYLKNKYNMHSSIYRSIRELMIVFPKTGRTSYGSENIKPLHDDIKKIVDMVVKKDPKISQVFNSYIHILKEKDKAIIDVCRKNNVDPEKHLLFKTHYEDIYRRLGNKVIESLFYIKKLNNKLENDNIKANIKKRMEKSNRSKIWDEALRLKIKLQNETVRCFEEFIRKMDQAKFKRLVEEGFIEL